MNECLFGYICKMPHFRDCKEQMNLIIKPVYSNINNQSNITRTFTTDEVNMTIYYYRLKRNTRSKRFVNCNSGRFRSFIMS